MLKWNCLNLMHKSARKAIKAENEMKEVGKPEIAAL